MHRGLGVATLVVQACEREMQVQMALFGGRVGE
jgi:hypothetical protein